MNLHDALDRAQALFEDDDERAAAAALLGVRAALPLADDEAELSEYAELARDVAHDWDGPPVELYDASVEAMRRRVSIARGKREEGEARADVVSTLVEWSTDLEDVPGELHDHALAATVAEADAALVVMTRAEDPVSWGHVHRCRADALLALGQKEHAPAKIVEATRSYRLEVDVLRRDPLPGQWNREAVVHDAQVRLADALLEWARIAPEGQAFLDEAIQLYEASDRQPGTFGAEYAAERIHEARALRGERE